MQNIKKNVKTQKNVKNVKMQKKQKTITPAFST